MCLMKYPAILPAITGGPVEALSLKIQPRHSKAIFHLSPLIPSQLNPAVYWNSLYNSNKLYYKANLSEEKDAPGAGKENNYSRWTLF